MTYQNTPIEDLGLGLQKARVLADLLAGGCVDPEDVDAARSRPEDPSIDV